MGVQAKDRGPRLVAFSSIVGGHLLVFWLVTSGLGRKALEVIAPPMMADIIEEEIKLEAPPPPPPPKFERPAIEIPLPIVDIQVPVENVVSNVYGKGFGKATVVRVAPTIDRRNSPPLADHYPPAARAAGLSGKVRLKTCVGEDGALQGIPVVEASSGQPDLDDAAVKYAKAVRYVKGTENGKARPMCFSWPVMFQAP